MVPMTAPTGENDGVLSVIGQLATAKGQVQQRDLAGDPDPWVLPAASYMRDQPARIPILFGHDETWELGQVAHLERSPSTGLLAVATIADDLVDLLDDEWFLSGGVRCVPTGPLQFGHARLREVSLTRRPGSIGTRPMRWSRSATPPGGMPIRWFDTWDRAVERMTTDRYRPARHLTIAEVDEAQTAEPVARRAARDLLPRSKPTPPIVATRHARDDAARAAAAAGASGFGWVEDGELRRVARFGETMGFA
jgi:hypothetical protein